MDADCGVIQSLLVYRDSFIFIWTGVYVNSLPEKQRC
jgi:hypothetical protein